MPMATPAAWLLTHAERDNPDSTVGESRDGPAWSAGNLVKPLIHGATYFAALTEAVRGMRAGDLLLFSDWRGDPDQVLDDAGTEIAALFSEAAERRVLVRGLVWRSHLDGLRFSAQENRSLSDALDAVHGCCLLDMRVRPLGSHHQKFVVLRHPGRPELDVAFVGGIDLCHGRRDDAEHLGDVQAAPISAEYGKRPPWHDAHLAIRGPAVREAETVFRERWDDPAPLSRNPLHRLKSYTSGADTTAVPLPQQLPAPPPCGPHAVELLRTYPRRLDGYPFATRGERSIAAGYRKALKNARDLIYLEDQYLWSRQVAEPFAQALRDNPELRLIAVVPLWPDQEGRVARSAMLVGRNQALDLLHEAGGDRVAVYGLENHAGTPVYVHAKIAVIDDVWASIGSGNLNLRSWTHDSELSCAVLDETPDPREPQFTGHAGEFARVFARDLRLKLALEHLDMDDPAELLDPKAAFQAFAETAAALDAWHTRGRTGPRPAGRVRPYRSIRQARWTIAWATPVYRRLFDPDGRPRSLRRAGSL
jgi:phosphatidylserine/phosphatidylglycerophosphate/cardiolipin synthase-like enzyme